jgi:protein-L-isoaspartate(D-aspartate) O-methyltransferase
MTTLNLQGIGMTSLRTRERMIGRLREQGISNIKVMEAMRSIPRHLFVDEALASRAYDDCALPISYGQTISQPYIVAKMSELLMDQGPRRKVLEIGTGCGYQTAILAQLFSQVYTVERIQPLQKQAKDRLWKLNVRNVSYLHNDGGWGWPDHAPFDAILVAAAAAEIPELLLQQMEIGAVMVIPVGRESSQVMQRVIRTESGYQLEPLETVSFVPLVAGKQH